MAETDKLNIDSIIARLLEGKEGREGDPGSVSAATRAISPRLSLADSRAHSSFPKLLRDGAKHVPIRVAFVFSLNGSS